MAESKGTYKVIGETAITADGKAHQPGGTFKATPVAVAEVLARGLVEPVDARKRS